MGGGGFLGLGPAPDTSAQDAAVKQIEEQTRLDSKNLEIQRNQLTKQRMAVIKSQAGGQFLSRQDML